MSFECSFNKQFCEFRLLSNCFIFHISVLHPTLRVFISTSLKTINIFVVYIDSVHFRLIIILSSLLSIKCFSSFGIPTFLFIRGRHFLICIPYFRLSIVPKTYIKDRTSSILLKNFTHWFKMWQLNDPNITKRKILKKHWTARTCLSQLLKNTISKTVCISWRNNHDDKEIQTTDLNQRIWLVWTSLEKTQSSDSDGKM